jgi:hypothetical protein
MEIFVSLSAWDGRRTASAGGGRELGDASWKVLGAFGLRRSSKTRFDNVFQVKHVNRYLRNWVTDIQEYDEG